MVAIRFKIQLLLKAKINVFCSHTQRGEDRQKYGQVLCNTLALAETLYLTLYIEASFSLLLWKLSWDCSLYGSGVRGNGFKGKYVLPAQLEA